jgi:hypothetical protein
MVSGVRLSDGAPDPEHIVFGIFYLIIGGKLDT